MITIDSIRKRLEKQGHLILDGGFATQLEARGHNINTKLWSAQLLAVNPEAITDVHLSYLESGADIIITAGYQASIDGFCALGFSFEEAEALMLKAFTLADRSREHYLGMHPQRAADTTRPLIAGSIGPYGAYLADGSEYRGDYGVSDATLRSFHESRLEIFLQSPPDLLACETVPSFQEAQILTRLLEQNPGIVGWISFSCKDDTHISDGTPISECAALLKESKQIFAVGINCTAPQHVARLIHQVHAAAPEKEIVVYPNSGEEYHAATRSWSGISHPVDFGNAAQQWFAAGARLIGGCCRTGPEHINAIKTALGRS